MRHLTIYVAIRTIVRLGSIRRAAEALAISPSALNRQVLALERDLGTALFERLPSGVRLSTAGEIYYRQFRDHLAGVERARARVADLAGLRIGHVAIAASPELCGGFLPRQIAAYRREHPAVSFSVIRTAHHAFGARLTEQEADLALIVQPQFSEGVDTIAGAELPLAAILRADGGAGPGSLRLHQLLDYDLVLPGRETGVNAFLSVAFRRRALQLRPAVESDVLDLPTLMGPRPALQICVAADPDPAFLSRVGLATQALHWRDIPPVTAILGQERGRSLPVAAAKFAEQMAAALDGESRTRPL